MCPTLQRMPQAGANSLIRRAALAVAALLALTLGVVNSNRIFNGGLPAPMDFAAFWTAGRLAVEGGNPYDSAAVRDVQRGIGLNDTAIMMWNPPWALTVVLPLGWLDFSSAYGLWLLFQLALVILGTELVWRGLGGSNRTRVIAHALALSFAPTLLLVYCGQLTSFVFVGLGGYLALRKRHPYLAGAVGALTAIKPHMLVLFALWLVVDALRSSAGRKVLLGGAVSLLLMSVPPLIANPNVWSQYVANATGGSSADHEHVASWAPPLAGWWLRQAVPGQPFAVQWLPLVLGVGCFLVRGRTATVPMLVGFSMLIAPYGVWHHDLVLMLLPILATTAALVEKPIRAAVAFGVVAFVLADVLLFAMILAKAPYEWFVWVVPATLLGCFATRRIAEADSLPALSLT